MLTPTVAMAVVAVALAVVLAVLLRDDNPSTFLTNTDALPPSWPIFYAVNGAALFFQMLSDRLKSPSMKLIEDAHCFMISRIVYTATELDIATLLGDDAMTIEELAVEANVVEPEHLARLLQAAMSLGYFQKDQNGNWRNNRRSSLLRKQHPAQLKYLVQSTAGFMYSFWAHSVMAVQETTEDNRAALHQQLFGSTTDDAFWSFLSQHPEKQLLFQKTMVAVDAVSLMSTVLDYDWSKFARVVDIGAQEGSFAKQLLASYPSTLQSAVLFDLPHVVTNAKRTWETTPYKERVTFVGGDFFQASTLPIAQDHDAFVMRNILHDWSDRKSLEILTNLRAAIGSALATLVIIELVPAPYDPFHGARVIDMHMMLMFGGKERYESDLRTLFDKAGFELVSVQQTRSPLRVVEARPV